MTVRRRPALGDVRPVGCAFVLLVFSVVFAAAAVPALPGAGAFVFLFVGVAGIVLCASGLVAAAGRSLGRRPVLELDDEGVRLPAPWPWPRARDRYLRWADVASVVLWSEPGRRSTAEHLAFLPARESAGDPPPSVALVALGLADLPGVTTAQWALPVSPGWDTAVEEVIAEVRRRDLPTADVRSR